MIGLRDNNGILIILSGTLVKLCVKQLVKFPPVIYILNENILELLILMMGKSINCFFHIYSSNRPSHKSHKIMYYQDSQTVTSMWSPHCHSSWSSFSLFIRCYAKFSTLSIRVYETLQEGETGQQHVAFKFGGKKNLSWFKQNHPDGVSQMS